MENHLTSDLKIREREQRSCCVLRKREMAAEIPCCGTKFSLYVLVIIGLVCFAGLMAGLTLGLMSLGLVDLEVLIKSGRPQDRISQVHP